MSEGMNLTTKMQGGLYLCATPIGNLEDITLRVLRTLREADLIAAEDTRTSRKLLAHFEIHTPTTSYHEFNKHTKARFLVEEMQKGKAVALITDAGTPCISDPGEELVRKTREAGLPVTGLPGPSALIDALSLSGLSARRFCFEGFLPNDKKERAFVLESLRQEQRTILLYEAPHRLRKTLAELEDALGSRRPLALCRELSKRHEEVQESTLGEAVAWYRDEEPRGEYVLVLAGQPRAEREAETRKQWEELSLADHMQRYLGQGMDEKSAMKAVSKDRGLSKREIYKAWKLAGDD